MRGQANSMRSGSEWWSPLGILSSSHRPHPARTPPQPRRTTMGSCRNRRDFLRVAGATLLAPLVELPQLRAAAPNPSLPVSIARCKDYDLEAVLQQLKAMMDQLGGLDKLVAGK